MSGEILKEPIEDFGLSKKGKSNTLFSKIGIVGCGLVGQNLARVASFYGLDVVFIEVSLEKIDEAFVGINKMLDHRIEHWGLTESEKRAMLSRISGTTDFDDLKGCDFVVEAIRAVDRGVKIKERKEIFRKIESVVDQNCIIATNSTTVIITELASDMQYKDRCISIHFFVSSPEARIVVLFLTMNSPVRRSISPYLPSSLIGVLFPLSLTFSFQLILIMSLPKGLRAIAVSLKCCIPKGIPMIVMQRSAPKKAWDIAIHRPPARSHITFISI